MGTHRRTAIRLSEADQLKWGDWVREFGMGNCLPNCNIYNLSIEQAWKISCSYLTNGAKVACELLCTNGYHAMGVRVHYSYCWQQVIRQLWLQYQYRQPWTVDQKSCYEVVCSYVFIELCGIEELIKFYEYHQRKQKCWSHCYGLCQLNLYH